MGLDITLRSKESVEKTCSCCGNNYNEHAELYWGNITHNLVPMAEAAGIYYYLWRPSSLDITEARQLIIPLEVGLKKLEENPDYYKKLNAKNGWGTYEHLIKFVKEVLEACKQFPNSNIKISK